MTFNSISHLSKCVRGIAFHWYPYLLANEHDPKNKSFTGIHIDIMEEAAKKFNFCFTVEQSTTLQYGEKTANGSFSGAIGNISRREYDVFLTGGTISYDRAKVIDFSEPTFVDTHTVYYTYPKVQPDISGFIKPFTLSAWLFIMFTTLAVFGVMVSLLKMKRSTLKDYGNGTIFKAFQVTFGPILSQSLPIFRGYCNLKLALSVWLPLSLILQLTYKGNLNAMLTTQTLRIPFQTIGDLISHKGEPVVTIFKETTMDSTLKKADENTTYGRLNKAVTRFGYDKIQEVFSNNSPNKYATIMTKGGASGLVHQAFSMKGYCIKALMRDSFQEVRIALMFPKNSTLKAKVDRVIIGFKEFGILNYKMDHQISNASKCIVRPNKISTVLRPLVMKDFYGTFALLAFGIGTSVIAFIAEVIVHTLYEVKQTKN